MREKENFQEKKEDEERGKSQTCLIVKNLFHRESRLKKTY